MTFASVSSKFTAFRANTKRSRLRMERSSGEIIIFIDADLQNAPEDIPRFIAKIHEGIDFGEWMAPELAARWQDATAWFLGGQSSDDVLHRGVPT